MAIDKSKEFWKGDVRRKYLRNRWFVVPLILPVFCFVFNALTEFMSWLIYDSNIEQRIIDILVPYYSDIFALGAFSLLLTTFAVIPLAVISIVFAVIKKISLTEMLVSFGVYFFAFFFASYVIASKV